MRRTFALSSLLVSFVWLAGCGSDSDPTPAKDTVPVRAETIDAAPELDPESSRIATKADLEGDFAVVGLEGADLADGLNPRIVFRPRYFAVDVGCNDIGGGYGLKGGVFQIGVVSVTEMFCSDRIHEAEDWLADFLADRPKVRTDGEALLFEGPRGKLKLVPETEASPVLQNRTWQLTSIGDGETVGSVPSGVRPATLQFREGEVLYSGCNNGTGTAEVGDGSIEFGSIKMTKRSCGQEADRLETQVMEVLRGEVEASWEGQNLVLSKGGKSLAFALAERD